MSETFMCANRWAEIEFSSVPSLCMDRQKLAFLNENKKGEIAHPDAPLRRDCRERLLAHIVDKGIAALKGKQLFPHELVAQVCHFTAEPPLWVWMCSVSLSLSCVPGDQCERLAPVSRRVGGARCAVGGCAQRAARASLHMPTVASRVAAKARILTHARRSLWHRRLTHHTHTSTHLNVPNLGILNPWSI